MKEKLAGAAAIVVVGGLLVVLLFANRCWDQRGDAKGGGEALAETLTDRGLRVRSSTCPKSSEPRRRCVAILEPGLEVPADVVVSSVERDGETYRDYTVSLIRHRYGDKTAAEIPEDFARAFDGAALSPVPPTCAPLLNQADRCTATFDGGTIEVVIAEDDTKHFPGVIAARELEALGATLPPPAGVTGLRFRCPQRAYRRGQLVRCPNAPAELASPTHALEVQVPAEGTLRGRIVALTVDDGGWVELSPPTRP